MMTVSYLSNLEKYKNDLALKYNYTRKFFEQLFRANRNLPNDASVQRTQ